MLKVLKAISGLRINKTPQSSEMYLALQEAYDSLGDDPKNKTMFLRNLFYILSIQRDHYLYEDLKIKGTNIGAQEFISARIIFLFLLRVEKKWTRDNMYLFFEFCSWKLLLYNQVTTTKGNPKTPAKVVRTETTIVDVKALSKLISRVIRNGGVTTPLLAKWLPKYVSTVYRTSKVLVGKDRVFEMHTAGTISGRKVEPGRHTVKEGDVIHFRRKMGREATARMELNNELIKAICKRLDWSIADYKQFRSDNLKRTPEFLFSSMRILEMSRADFIEWLSGLSAGQQVVVARRLTDKRDDKITLVKKWGRVSEWYMDWFKAEEKTAQVNRNMMDRGKRTMKSNIKTTGLQTVDLLSQMHGKRVSSSEINLLHTNLMARLDMQIPVFCAIDGSGSMLSSLGSRNWNGMQVDSKYSHLTYFDIAITIALSFMMTNPEPKYKDSFCWFSRDCTVIDRANFKVTNPESFRKSRAHTVPPYKILDFKKPFTDNLLAMKTANPQKAQGTNVGAIFEQFLKFDCPVEQLPQIILCITDEEYNRGLPLPDALNMAARKGWEPLVIFWGIKSSRNLDQYKDLDNVLVVRGFSEAILTQIVGAMKRGSVRMEDELWAVNDMPELQVIDYEAVKTLVRV